MLATQLKLAALKDSLTELNRAISILETREKEGEGSKLDRLRAQRERHEIDAELSFLDSLLATERGSLLAYLPAGESVEELTGDLAIRTSSLDTAELLRKTLATRADIQAERQRIEQYRMEQRAADRLRYPEPVLNAGLKRAELGQPSIANGPVIGLSMAIPIFQKGKSEVSRFAAEQERATARLDILVRRTQATLDAAARVFNIRKAALDKYPASGREIVDIATIAYQEGETGILQLLDAYRVERQSRLRRIDLEAATREAWLTLESVVGEELPR
jgi:cobalt-zinc-cadmium efflux system outer membrane protein